MDTMRIQGAVRGASPRDPCWGGSPARAVTLLAQTGRDSGQAKAQADAPVARLVPEAERRAAEPGDAFPVAAPEHPDGARVWPRWVGHFAGWIVAVPVGTPLRDVSVHVEQAEGI